MKYIYCMYELPYSRISTQNYFKILELLIVDLTVTDWAILKTLLT